MVKKNKDFVLGEMFKETQQRNQMNYKVGLALKILDEWNHRFDLEERGSSIYLVWEFEIASYFMETKIDNLIVRRCLGSNILIEQFMYNEYRRWSKMDNTIEDYCFVEEWKSKGQNNTCQQFMVYTFIRTIQFLENKLGKDMVIS